jgi:hypothetical protein
VASCAVCTVHVETRSAGFLVEPQNQGRWFVSGLATKPLGRFLIGLSLEIDSDGFRRFGLRTCCDGFLQFGLKTGGDGFSWFGLKTGSFGLVIWASKSPRRFLGLCLKTKWALVCRLHHKTDGGRSARDTRRDLAGCFAWKQVWLGFPNLA